MSDSSVDLAWDNLSKLQCWHFLTGDENQGGLSLQRLSICIFLPSSAGCGHTYSRLLQQKASSSIAQVLSKPLLAPCFQTPTLTVDVEMPKAMWEGIMINQGSSIYKTGTVIKFHKHWLFAESKQVYDISN